MDWRLFRRTENGRPRSVILQGEYHLAKPGDISGAQPVIVSFDNIATENGNNTDEPSPSYKVIPVAALMMTPKLLILTALAGRLFDSPMDHARETANAPKRFVRNAEKLHVPSWTEEIDLLFMGARDLAWVLVAGSLFLIVGRTLFRANFRVPLMKVVMVYLAVVASDFVFDQVTGDPIVRNRDISMSRYIDEFVKDQTVDGPLLVIVGKAHLKNMGDILTKDYGFRELPIDDTLDARPVRRGLPAPRPL